MPLLAVLASLSPLLTLAWLWQIKEWRWDRVLEHIRREGWQGLFGKTRLIIVGGYLAGQLMAGWSDGEMVTKRILAITLIILALLTVVQFLLHKQRRPAATKKAITVTGTAALLTIILTAALRFSGWDVLLPLPVLLQPLTLACAWLLWWPIDSILKQKIMNRARLLREAHPDLTVIGVTGSVGKTTTKELLACVLKDLKPSVTPAHVNSEIGVAQWMINTLAGRRPTLVIVEMGAYRKGEISLMSTYVQQTIAVVTHVGTQHIALFGSQQNLFEAKSELIAALPQNGRAFLNGDNELCRTMASLSPCPVTMVGTGGSCDLEACAIEETPRGVSFRSRDTVFDVPLHGTHNVTNVLLALAIGEYLGISLERMREHLRSFAPLSHTFSVREESGVRILDDTHNSSAASVKAAIAWARTQPEERKILLAAGLIEMGDLQSPAEQELGALAGKVFERIVVIDPQSARNFAAGAEKHVEVFSGASAKISPGSLFVCAGRMTPGSIQKFLP